MVFFGAAFAEPVKKIKRRKLSANDKLNIAGVGAGGKGKSDISALAGRNNIVALCDVDDERAAETFNLHPDAPKYKDFRVMLEKEGKNIDAVTVSTPDHMHAIIAMTAMQLGKHVYVQKPLTHDIWEARQLQEMAKKYKVCTQMGNQGHAGEGVRRITEWLNAGVIGPVKTVICWTNRPVWPQGGLSRPTENPPVPATLDWDLWLGTAPERPYNKAYVPHNWRGWWDFGCGALGDMGCHIMDPAYTSLELGYPTSVEATSEGNMPESGPKTSTLKYEFPARGGKPPVTFYWYDGGLTPKWPEGIPADAKLGDNDNCGTLFVGDKGMITCGTYGGEPRLVPYAKPDVPRTIEKSPGHYLEWVEACKGGKPSGGNFDYAGPFTEMVLLGNIAIRVGQKIEYDPKEMKITNIPDANKYIKREYRTGWTI
jgi:predicted dehydrogenase